jgi:hypothetical protein
MLREDYLMRQIRAIAELCARVLGLVAAREHAQAEEELDAALDDLLKIDRTLFETLDAHSLLPLLGTPEQIEAIARVLETRAALERSRGDDEAADRLERRARIFAQHARTKNDGAS